MNITSDEPATEADSACCPRCGASDAVLSLLTSMTRYFACRRCDCRWQVSVVTTPATAESEPRNHATPPGPPV